MSQEATLYGSIMLWRVDVQRARVYGHNRDVIAGLPEKATYPDNLLTQDMFTVPMDESATNDISSRARIALDCSGFYRNQVIHFGASYNHLSDFWHLWLEQFENLLLRLRWHHAFLHLNIECIVEDAYHWELDWSDFNEEPVLPWTFTGGPRSFLY